jgi:hypothetical protein
MKTYSTASSVWALLSEHRHREWLADPDNAPLIGQMVRAVREAEGPEAARWLEDKIESSVRLALAEA